MWMMTLMNLSFAFVEFEDTRDAEEAYNKMHGRRINGSPISVQASWIYLSALSC